MSSSNPKTDAPRGLEGFLRTGYLIHDVSRLRRMLYDQRSRHLGITRSQWWVLFNLARHGDVPLNQNELAQLLEMGSAAIGELLQRLEKGGFIKRQAVPGDRRSKHVVIAARGLEVLEHMRLVARASNDAIMAGITADEQRVLNDLLSKMKSNLLSQIAIEQVAGDANAECDRQPAPPAPTPSEAAGKLRSRNRIRSAAVVGQVG